MKRINKLAILLVLVIAFQNIYAQDSLTFKTIYEVKTSSVKNQQRSGTCWAFAAISFVETELIRMGKSEYDLSEMYMVRNVYPVKADNFIRMHGKANFSAGGQAHDVLNAMSRVGIVPESVYKGLNYGKDYHDHSELDDYLTVITKEALKKKRKSRSTMSEELLQATLNEYLGPVPERFNYEGNSYTPQSFLSFLDFDPEDYVEITSYKNYPYHAYSVLQVPDNWSYDSYYNLPLDEFMKVIDNALKKGYSVCWDGDVSGQFERSTGIARLEEGVVIDQDARQQAFDAFESTDDHLMHIVGIAKDQHGRKYYITKNSWGTDHKYKGFWYMSEQYVRLHTVAVLVHKDVLPKK
jgi:bleomycin hydrolase